MPPSMRAVRMTSTWPRWDGCEKADLRLPSLFTATPLIFA